MKKKKWGVILEYLLLCGFIGELVYHEIWSGALLLPFFPLYMRVRRNAAWEEELYQRSLQFRDMLNSLQAALEAGYSLENAFREARKELSAMYSERAYICVSLDQILRRMGNGMVIEEAFREFAVDSGLEDTENVAESIELTKRLGGDLLHVIRTTTEVIAAKLEVKREIRTITAQKRMEGNVMKLMPPGMLLYFRIFSPDYLSPLYEGVEGNVLMTVLFGSYLFMVWLMEHFTNIEV